ncbi:MAG TPA: glycosyltransferase family 4 protein [Ramlibacter sp.]|jgi:glycosyltransferase involved in cell wall biosynthesis
MLGARRHYAVPRLLHEAGLLDCFYTDLYLGNKRWLHQAGDWMPSRLMHRGLQRVLARSDLVLPPAKVHSFDLLGLWYAWARRRASSYSDIQQVYRTMSERFARRIGKRGFGDSYAVWGFNNASLELFHNARSAGLKCVLEQTILPARLQLQLMREEAERWPGWQARLAFPETDRVTEKRAEAEWELADLIVVGSEFVRGGLLRCGVPENKVQVVPYGVDVERFQAAPTEDMAADSPLKVLFAGEVGLRKGVPDLLEALRRLGPTKVKARFAGNVTLDRAKLAPYLDVAEFLGPVPRLQMPKLYRWANVFVLPSVVEGSAAVTYEALLSGLPVITTPNAGSVVRHDQSGYIVDIRSPHQIADALGQYCGNRLKLREHREALRGIREYASLSRYGADLKALVAGLGWGVK